MAGLAFYAVKSTESSVSIQNAHAASALAMSICGGLDHILQHGTKTSVIEWNQTPEVGPLKRLELEEQESSIRLFGSNSSLDLAELANQIRSRAVVTGKRLPEIYRHAIQA